MLRSILLFVVLLQTALLAGQIDHLGGYWRNDQGIGANWAHWKDQVWFTSINPDWKEYFAGKVVAPNRIEGRLVHINLHTWERQELPLVMINSAPEELTITAPGLRENSFTASGKLHRIGFYSHYDHFSAPTFAEQHRAWELNSWFQDGDTLINIFYDFRFLNAYEKGVLISKDSVQALRYLSFNDNSCLTREIFQYHLQADGRIYVRFRDIDGNCNKDTTQLRAGWITDRTLPIGRHPFKDQNIQGRSMAMPSYVRAAKPEQKINTLEESRDQPLYQQMRFYVGLILSLAVLLGFRYWWQEQQRLRQADLRRHIARELHDDIGSTISSISILTEAARRGDVQQSADLQLDAIGKKAREALDNIGDIMWSLKTPRIAAEALFLRMKEFAVETLEAQGTEVIFSVEKSAQPLPLDSEQSKDSYLFFKEAVNNAAKYAQARQVRITVKTKNKAILLEISDDGKGFDLETVKKGNGLRNMQARAERLDGKLSIATQPGQGTQIRLHFKP